MGATGATRRFDSSIEPQDGVAESNGVNGSRPARAHGAHRKPTKGRQTKLLSAGVVTAAVVAAIGILLLRSDPAARQDAPSDPTPASTAAPTTVPTAPSQPVNRPVESAAPAPPPPPAASTAAEVTTQPTVAVEPPAVPPPAPTTVTNAPEAGEPQPPTTRPPISVAPETRPPFPNQTPPTGGDRDRGGLLGGGGLL